ncbi:MAG: protein-ADP-ribose hydrolase [Lachnospiraceae bacterium]
MKKELLKKAVIDSSKCVGCGADKIHRLIQLLLADMPEYAIFVGNFPENIAHQRMFLRSLMNVRYPGRELPMEFYSLQDEFLSEETAQKGIVEAETIPSVKRDARLSLWQGDITRLKVDAIVNAANSQMLGCFVPCHGCIDNAIHSAAGLQLREECFSLMQKQGHEEPTGHAKITKGYNLPARYVIHTVGPVIDGQVTEKDQVLLASCYHSCLSKAEEYGLHSIAFCCISTGEFHFSNDKAASVAVGTVLDYFENNPTTSIKKVIFNVFKDIDQKLYMDLLE